MANSGLGIALGILGALAGGAVIGGLHFGGLWLTVSNLPEARRPALLGMASFLGRLVLTAGGFVALAYFGQWYHVVLALAAAIGVRSYLQWTVKQGVENESDS